jgi:hypothetical protein
MSVDPAEVVSIGTTGVAVTRLGFGAASIGGLFAEVEDEDARATIEHAMTWGSATSTSRPCPLKEFECPVIPVQRSR